MWSLAGAKYIIRTVLLHKYLQKISRQITLVMVIKVTIQKVTSNMLGSPLFYYTCIQYAASIDDAQIKI